MRTPFRTLLSLVLCGLLLTAASCEIRPSGSDPDATSPAKPNDGDSGQATNTLAELETLDVTEWHSMSGYSRSKFRHWRSQGESCDTRETVLKRDASAFKIDESCKVTGGTWKSAYDGKTVTDPQTLDIDHVVPLANAWRTGAWDWSDDERSDFANDLTRPQLLAVTAATNRSKGDQDPSEWRPPLRSYWCEYARDWVAVKVYWKLSITSAEKSALKEMLDTC